MPRESKPRIASAPPQLNPEEHTKSNSQSSKPTAPLAACEILSAGSIELQHRKLGGSPLPALNLRPDDLPGKPAAPDEVKAAAGKPAPEPKPQLLLPKRTKRTSLSP